ncbi:anti-anti-sigma factor [Streptomyces sp. LBL]|uniref:STAS domain-containing protein n=1 Tax=Streptomyces sp. LBL TaxID=2940562 RepID=UPI002476CDFA|nr:STAS domain-containing protein [Streptomyces sp. LBL]MDH6622523.1 anti-anti-sigma factor [Streptomyces sp. LBL]
MADIPDVPGHGMLVVTRDTIDGVTVLSGHGEIDSGSAPVLRDALPPADQSAGPRIVIDLSRVTFMDSSGINALVSAHQSVRESGRLQLADVQDSVMRTLQPAGLDTVVP